MSAAAPGARHGATGALGAASVRLRHRSSRPRSPREGLRGGGASARRAPGAERASLKITPSPRTSRLGLTSFLLPLSPDQVSGQHPSVAASQPGPQQPHLEHLTGEGGGLLMSFEDAEWLARPATSQNRLACSGASFLPRGIPSCRPLPSPGRSCRLVPAVTRASTVCSSLWSPRACWCVAGVTTG